MRKKKYFMTFREFRAWCDDRVHDGYWGPGVAITCIAILEDIRKTRFWRKKARWAEINEDNNVWKAIVEPVNKKIQEYNIERLNAMLDERGTAESDERDKNSQD